jgi:pyruvate carboxylase
MMVTSGLTRAQVEDPAHEVAFPESVVQFFHGDIGQPYQGFPVALQKKVLKGRAPLTTRPGEVLPPADLDAERAAAEKKAGRAISDAELASYLMYPKVFVDYAKQRAHYGNVGVLPTPTFFYGMEVGEELSIDLERGKTLIVRLVACSEAHEDGSRTVFFELNGQPRSVRVADKSTVAKRPPARKAEIGDPNQVGAPMPGNVVTVAVKAGQKVAAGDTLVTLEAMKMEAAVRAERDAEVAEVVVRPGQHVDAKDLLVMLR